MSNTQRSGRRFVDAFGTPISDGTTNLLDIASHYPYSPERWRVIVDSSRVFPEYDSVSQYNHAGPNHEIIPGDGETVALQTAERPRYVVSYELETSFACNISRLLQPGDIFRAGPWDGTDGWYIEQTGDQGKDDVTLVVEEAGSRILEKPASLRKTLRFFSRFELKSSWYRVGGQEWRQTFTDKGATNTLQIGRTSVEPEGGPRVGNLPFRYEITRGSGNAPITLNAGSVGIKNLGQVTQFSRVKTYDVPLETGTAGDWVPLAVIRKDPTRSIVNLQLTDLRILEYGGAGDVQVVVRACDPSKVLDSEGSPIPDGDYFTPEEMSPRGSVLETAYTVNESPDGTGTPVTSITSAAPRVAPTATQRMGGYQIGYAALYAGGPGTVAARRTSGIQQKRALFGEDIGVILVNAANAAEVLNLEITTEQQW